MSRSKHSEAEIVGAIRQMDAGRRAEDVARELGVSNHTLYASKANYGGMDVSEARRPNACGVRTRSCGSWWRT